MHGCPEVSGLFQFFHRILARSMICEVPNKVAAEQRHASELLSLGQWHICIPFAAWHVHKMGCGIGMRRARF
jgi:hypothetical protein